MSDLRERGSETPGPSDYSPRDRQNFANQLDRFLAKNLKKPGEITWKAREEKISDRV